MKKEKKKFIVISSNELLEKYNQFMENTHIRKYCTEFCKGKCCGNDDMHKCQEKDCHNRLPCVMYVCRYLSLYIENLLSIDYKEFHDYVMKESLVFRDMLLIDFLYDTRFRFFTEETKIDHPYYYRYNNNIYKNKFIHIDIGIKNLTRDKKTLFEKQNQYINLIFKNVENVKKIIDCGFSNEILDALILMTHDKVKDTYLEYLLKIAKRGSDIAYQIKLADIEDNSNDGIKEGTLKSKYRLAYFILLTGSLFESKYVDHVTKIVLEKINWERNNEVYNTDSESTIRAAILNKD